MSLAPHLKHLVHTKPIVVVGAMWCSHCSRSKQLLDDAVGPSKYLFVDTEMDSVAGSELSYLGFSGIPQIFIKGKHVHGGSIALMKLDDASELQTIVSK